ncbi:MAG: hypothetical protein U1D00_04880 [Mycobacterium sp.]|nr:hypothetical protein [Mycobacterium sp.]
MSLVKNAAVGAFLGGSLLVTTGLGTAMAQPDEPPPGPDGLVTVLVDGSTAQDSVSLEDAAAAAAEVCAGDPAAILGLAQLADADGASQTVCANVSIIQNSTVPVQSVPSETVEPETPAVPGDGNSDVPFITEGG